MENWQIILAIAIVGLSIVMPIYYSYKSKKQKAESRSAEAPTNPTDITFKLIDE